MTNRRKKRLLMHVVASSDVTTTSTRPPRYRSFKQQTSPSGSHSHSSGYLYAWSGTAHYASFQTDGPWLLSSAPFPPWPHALLLSVRYWPMWCQRYLSTYFARPCCHHCYPRRLCSTHRWNLAMTANRRSAWPSQGSVPSKEGQWGGSPSASAHLLKWVHTYCTTKMKIIL